MKNKFKRFLPFFIVLTLLFSFFTSFALALSPQNKNDYSRPGYSDETYNETYDAVSFLKKNLT